MNTVLGPIPPKDKTSWVPSRKWAASTIGAIGTLAIMYLTTGTWDVEESVGAVTLTVTALTTYLVSDTSVTQPPKTS
jgi:hypothetical protein